eukprot:g4770.t1
MSSEISSRGASPRNDVLNCTSVYRCPSRRSLTKGSCGIKVPSQQRSNYGFGSGIISTRLIPLMAANDKDTTRTETSRKDLKKKTASNRRILGTVLKNPANIGVFTALVVTSTVDTFLNFMDPSRAERIDQGLDPDPALEGEEDESFIVMKEEEEADEEWSALLRSFSVTNLELEDEQISKDKRMSNDEQKDVEGEEGQVKETEPISSMTEFEKLRLEYREGMSQEATPIELKPQDKMSQDEMSQNAISQDEMLQEEMSQDEMPEDEMSQDEMLQELEPSLDAMIEDETSQDAVLMEAMDDTIELTDTSVRKIPVKRDPELPKGEQMNIAQSQVSPDEESSSEDVEKSLEMEAELIVKEFFAEFEDLSNDDDDRTETEIDSTVVPISDSPSVSTPPVPQQVPSSSSIEQKERVSVRKETSLLSPSILRRSPTGTDGPGSSGNSPQDKGRRKSFSPIVNKNGTERIGGVRNYLIPVAAGILFGFFALRMITGSLFNRRTRITPVTTPEVFRREPPPPKKSILEEYEVFDETDLEIEEFDQDNGDETES